MSHLAPLISDLALILICVGIITLIFKKLKQPRVYRGRISLQSAFSVYSFGS